MDFNDATLGSEGNTLRPRGFEFVPEWPHRSHWGEVFGDDAISLQGDSYRLEACDLGRVPAAKANA